MISTHFLFSLSQQRKSKIFFFFKDDFHYYKHEKEYYAQTFLVLGTSVYNIFLIPTPENLRKSFFIER